MAALLGACAAAGPRDQTAGPAVRSADEISTSLFASLQRDDTGAAAAAFSPRMARALETHQLREVWRQIVDQLGPLQSFRIVTRARKDGVELRKVALSFEHGAARGEVAVDSSTGQIEGFFIRPAPDNPPPAAAPGVERRLPDGRREVDVVLGKAPWTLGGTITLPAGKGPFPAVVLVHGSGPQDRDETIGPNKPFRDLAEALALHRIATLRYDKRTRVHPVTDVERFTVEDEVIIDAIAAVHLLQQRPDVHPGGIFVVGHSLGAQLAPEIAARAGAVAGVVMLAAPGRPLPQIIVEQMSFLGNASPEELQAIRSQAARILNGKAADSEKLLGVPAGYFRDLLRRDQFKVARDLAKPILLLRGERDYQVTAQDQRLWQDALAGSRAFTAYTLPALNHLFIPGAGPPGPQEYTRSGHVHPSVAVRISVFVKGALAGIEVR
jgi:dienelactone hydrolase